MVKCSILAPANVGFGKHSKPKWRVHHQKFPGGFAPRPNHLPFTMVRHITQNIMESSPHDICHSFNICYSHSEWALQCPAFYKLLPKAIFTKTDRNQTFYLIYIFQEISFLDKLPFGRRAKFGCVYAILEVVIANFSGGACPQTP